VRLQIEALRRMSGPERLSFASDLTLFVHELTLAGIRARLPKATDAEVEAEPYRVVFGPELADSVLAHRSRIRGGAGSRR